MLRAAGIDPASPEGQAIIRKYIENESTRAGFGEQTPMSIKEWQAFQAMTPDQQAAYLGMKRAGSVFDIGGVPQLRTPGGATEPLATPEEVAANKARLAAATAQGTATGEAAAGAPGQIATLDEALAQAQKISTMPGLDASYGTVAGRTPSIKQATVDFEAQRTRMVDLLSLAARGQLKGQGPVSNFEQEMLRNAQTILSNPRISPEQARAEIRRIELWLAEKRSAQQQLPTILPGSSAAQAAPAPVIRYRRDSTGKLVRY
jgi:hypothetical protein